MDVDDQIAFGKNVRAMRESANITRDVVAERAEITVEYLGEVERGEKYPALKVTRSIARSIGVPPARFYEFEDQEAGTPIDQMILALSKRTPEQQRQALRVIKALFNI
jgi:transcriptional regulator with XRE-family HTH domain